ncbi:MAG: S8 family serine peptidase [Eubacterium sp.]|nr:S8 family serine peptidase [Eubacterium sp.]
MYCEYCGSLIEEGALFCTSCGNPVSNASQISGEENRIKVTFPIYDTTTMPIDGNKTKVNTPKQLTENKKKDKRLKKTKSPSKNRFRKRIIAIVVAIVLLIGAVGAYFIWRSDEGEKAYFKPFTYADIEFPESGDAYIRNELVLTGNQDATYDDIEDLAEDAAGEIVGYISISNDYQIQFDGGKGKDELDSIIEEWSDSSLVASVGYHYVLETDGSMFDYSNDEWWNYQDGDKPDDFEEDWDIYEPQGNNWGVESIWMPKVWDSDTEFKPVKVGVIDTMFELDHPDFTKSGSDDSAKSKSGKKIVEAVNNPDQINYSGSVYDVDQYHGTHVAGIIGAYINNDVGIAGVAQNSLLYGYSMASDGEDTYTSIMQWKTAIATELIEGIKLINISMEFNIFGDSDIAKETINTMNDEMETFLNACIDKKYDFLIIKSFDSLETQSPGFLTTIKEGKVRDHIIVVGGALPKKNPINDYVGAISVLYTHTDTKAGRLQENVDIYAPGDEIDSDVPGGLTENHDGSSVAAPFVTGEAALIWGVNEKLTSLEVKKLILENYIYDVKVNFHDDDDNMKTIFRPYANAYFAVQAALGKQETSHVSNAFPKRGENECIMTVPDGNWKQAYLDILGGFVDTGEQSTESSYYIHSNDELDIKYLSNYSDVYNLAWFIDIAYINDDDIPELIFTSDNFVYVLSYRDGKIIKYVFTVSGNDFGYSERKGIVTGLNRYEDYSYYLEGKYFYNYRCYLDISGDEQKLIAEGGFREKGPSEEEPSNVSYEWEKDYYGWRTISEGDVPEVAIKDPNTMEQYRISEDEYNQKEEEYQKKYNIHYFRMSEGGYTLDEAIEYIKSL